MLFWGEQPPLTPFGCAGRQFFDHKNWMKDKTAPRDRTNGAVLDPLSGDPRGRGGRTGHGALGAWGSWRREYREVICQLFIRTHDESLSVAAMRVNNPDRSPLGINRCERSGLLTRIAATER